MMDSGSSGDDEAQLDRFKITIIGNGAVGKTSLISHFCETGFNQEYKQTIGLNFYSKKITIPGSNGRQAMLQIWDIGGQQLGGTMIRNYLHNADAICLVYDVTNSSSFKDADDWRRAALEVCAGSARTPKFLLVGNKTDLPARQVTQEQHNAYAKANNMLGYLISARSGDHVNSLFGRIAADLCGVIVNQQDLELMDNVMGHVESSPTERRTAKRAPELTATFNQEKKKKFIF